MHKHTGAPLLERMTGGRVFVGDIAPPGTLWAAVARSTSPAAQIRKYHLPDRSTHPEVVRIFLPCDVPAVRYNPAALPESTLTPGTEDKVMLTASPRHVGDGIAVVVATSLRAARRAARAITVDEITDTDVSSLEEARHHRARGRVTHGDPRTTAQLARCHHVQEDVFSLPAVSHMCLEPHTCIAVPGEKGIEVLTNTQCPVEVRRTVAAVLGVPVRDVRIIKVTEGGGFGAKQEIYEEALVAFLARELGTPVGALYSREEEFRSGRQRGRVVLRAAAGMDRHGQIEALALMADLDSGAYASHTPAVLSCMAGHVLASYPSVDQYYAGTAYRTNNTPSGAYRGYGVAEAAFAVEQLVDRLAVAAGIGPLDLRWRNTSANSPLQRCLAAAVDLIGDPARKETGIAIGVKHSVTTVSESSPTEARLLRSGEVQIFSGTCDSGTGSNAALRRIAAETLGVPMERVYVIEGDTADGYVDLGSSSQRSVYVGGSGVRLACVALGAEIRSRRDRTAGTMATAENGMDAAPAELAPLFHSEEPHIAATVDHPVSGTGGSAIVLAVHSSIDELSGDVTVDDYTAVVDCGRVVDETLARGQVHGGVLQAIGHAVRETAPGRSVGASLANHGVLRARDAPDSSLTFVRQGSSAAPRGLGELPVLPVAPAIANSLRGRDSVDVRSAPFRRYFASWPSE